MPQPLTRLGNLKKQAGKARTLCVAAIIVVALAHAANPLSALAGVPTAEPSFQKGMSFAAWWPGQYASPQADISLESLTTTGADWIAVIVTGYQATHTSTSIVYDSHPTPTDADLIHIINQAHSLGLNVMLKPHLDLPEESVTGIWRGHIGTEFTTEAEWAAWFASYRDFIEHYAALAQTLGVEQFSVGTELLGTTHREAEWRGVIAGVRAIYDGDLVYAALHGGEETAITWWDAVDYIGVDAYYPLADDYDPTRSSLEASWQSPINTMAALAAAHDKPVLLTEIGYRSHDGSANHPWESWCDATVDLAEQEMAYEVAFEMLYDQPWLGGIFWWTWLPDPWSSGPCDDGYSPHQKPAERVLRQWYGGALPPPSLPLLPDSDTQMSIYAGGLAAGWEDWSWGATTDTATADTSLTEGAATMVTLAPWGALSFWHPSFDPAPFHWLEFSIRGDTASQPRLQAFLETADGTRLPEVPVNDCRHVAEGTIEAGIWKTVRILLSDLDVPGEQVVRVSIQNDSGEDTASFWIANLRLVGATEPSSQIFLPLVMGGRP